MIKLNQNHWYGLVFSIIGWVIGWYSIVLIGAEYKNKKFPITPTKNQWIGGAFAVGIAILSWFRYIYTIQGDENRQG